jgi:hypothetical protein
MKICFYLYHMKQTNTHTMTLANLPFGTTVLYNDQANFDLRLTIIGHTEDQFGKWVEVLTENGFIEPMKGHHKIDGNRFTLA